MMPPENFLIFLPTDALRFPLSKYIIKLILIPSLVTFRSKKGQTLARGIRGILAKKSNIKPCGMHEWFDCHMPSYGGFTEYFSTARQELH